MNFLPRFTSGFPLFPLPEIARLAVQETQQNTGAPIELVAGCVLNAMFLTCQSLINVRRREHLVSPCSAFFLAIAESGERKSAVDKLILKPIRDFEEEMAEKYRSDLKDFEIELEIWEAHKYALEKRIRKAYQLDTNPASDIQKLKDLQHIKPIKPKQFRFLFSDTTPEALLKSLSENWPAGGLVSDESYGVLNGHALRSFAPYNFAWDGAPQFVDRKSTESFKVTDIRLGISMMIQPGPFKAFMEKRGSEATDTGFLARFLVAYPSSTQGYRSIGTTIQSFEHLPTFHQRMTALLKRGYYANLAGVEREEIKFSPEAQEFWNWAHDEFEKSIGFGGEFQHTKSHAAKAADNLARMAAVFHYFAEAQGDIPLETLQSALNVILWYEREYTRLFSPAPEIPQYQLDANQLDQWLQSKPQQRYFRRNYIRQYAPYSLRNLARLEPALHELTQRGRISIDCHNDTQIIDQYPLYLLDSVALEYGMRQGKKQSQV